MLHNGVGEGDGEAPDPLHLLNEFLEALKKGSHGEVERGVEVAGDGAQVVELQDFAGTGVL